MDMQSHVTHVNLHMKSRQRSKRIAGDMLKQMDGQTYLTAERQVIRMRKG